MNHYLFKQFNQARQGLLNEIENLDADLADVQPEGFNNTIHWHIGHILTVSEQFLFGFPNQSKHLPENYASLFGNGTKPADWTEDVPGVDVLADQLKKQLERMNAIPVEQLDNKLEQPVLGNDTYGGLAVMAVFHETYHTGQIHAMKLAAKAAK